MTINSQKAEAGGEDVYLASGYTVSHYRQLEDAKKRDEIATMVQARFTERYLDPVDHQCSVRNGFAIMAISCLMIEALESFRLGWPDTNRRGRRAFRSFLTHWDEFAVFRSIADEFYTNVRCGILHQAETTGAWKIRREGPLWDSGSRTINAARFVKALREVLDSYVGQLRTEEWDSEAWQHLRMKLNVVCENAQGHPASG